MSEDDDKTYYPFESGGTLHDDGSDAVDDHTRRRPPIPPPPTNITPGWLSHIPVPQPEQLPQAPASFLYEASPATRPPELPRSSPSFTYDLLSHHRAYAPPPFLDGLQQAQSTAQPAASPSSTTFDSQQLVHAHNGEPLGRHPSNPDLAPTPDDSNGGLFLADWRHTPPPQHAAIHGVDNRSQWTAGFETSSRLPPLPQDVQYRTDGVSSQSIERSAYHANTPMYGGMPELSFRHIVGSSPPAYDPYLDQDVLDAREFGEDGLETQQNAVETPIGRKRKRNAEESEPKVKRPRGRPKQSAEEKKRGRKKGEIRGPRLAIDPGDDFMKIYNEAVDTFLEQNDIAKAQTLVLQAISKNPEIFAAHSLLADIHFARGDHDAGIDALMVGLHAHLNDVELWRQVADTILGHHDEGHQKRIERAMYCYGGILRKNPKDLDARFQRAECARLMGNWNRAFNDFNLLLQDDPHNSSVLAQFARLCQDVGDVAKAIAVYEEHFDYYRDHGLSDEEHFTWRDIGMYVDLLLQTGETAQAIVLLKRLSRWLCGRQDEIFWEELVGDDREFDQMHYPRRLDIPEFEPNRYPEHDYGDALPLDLRGKLGVMRLKLNFREEAQSHFTWLEPDLEGEESLVEEYSDTFYEVAKALHDAKEHEQALHFYDALHNAEIDLGVDFFMDMAASCFVCEQKERAIEFYISALKLDPDNIEARTQLTKLYGDLGDRENALKYGNEAVVMAQSMIPPNSQNRKYERKENRLLREAAERALKAAFRLPKGPGKKKGKVPKGLQYRTRYRRKFERWVPQYDTPPPEPGTEQSVLKRKYRKRKTKATVEVEAENDRTTASPSPVPSSPTPLSPIPSSVASSESPIYDRPIKVPKKAGRPVKPKPVPRKLPSQENAIKHYEEMQQLYKTLINHQEAMREGEEVATNVWMDCAIAMVEDFRSVRVFYPGERHKKFEGYTTHTPRPRPATPGSGSVRSSAAPIDASQPGDQTPSTSTVTAYRADIKKLSTRRLAPPSKPDEYCDIPFSSWLDIFLELALLQANSGTSDSQSDSYALLNAAIDCSLFYHDEQSMIQIHSCWLACCLTLGDDFTLYNIVIRWFMREFAFCTDTYRLYAAINLVNELPLTSTAASEAIFKSGPNQKFIFRQIMSIDKLLPADYNKDGSEGGVPAFMRRHREELRKLSNKVNKEGIIDTAANDDPDADDAEEARAEAAENATPATNEPGTTPAKRDRWGMVAIKAYTPTEMDVVLFILYAQIMMASGSFPNALSYLYRAYSLDPTNTVCLLSLSLCYMHELFKRQTANRHSYALMGWSWFGKYEAERIKWATRFDEQAARAAEDGEEPKDFNMVDVIKREIEFNKARCWAMMGMADLGVRGYQKVLDLAPEKQIDEADGERDQEEWTMEAAYAMATVYASNGNVERAREIAERYLVVE